MLKNRITSEENGAVWPVPVVSNPAENNIMYVIHITKHEFMEFIFLIKLNLKLGPSNGESGRARLLMIQEGSLTAT